MNNTSQVQKPNYKHDCNECIYLGSNELTDFYFHINNITEKSHTSLIARYSSKPSDYFSMPLNTCKDLLEAEEIEADSVFALCYARYLNFIKISPRFN